MKAVRLWLFACAAAVLAMAVIGAITRLTESGLSITEWKPVTGAIPPLNDAAWQAEFDLYRQTPQYLKINKGMSLSDFKSIYFWEWFHRLWGRAIGLLYALPFAYFLLRRRLPPGSLPALCGILALGLAQGAMGWYMVQSGLVDRPSVSQYRLAAHLMLAFALYAALLHVAFSLGRAKESAAPLLRRHARAALGLIALTMTWGAFVAGLDGGLVYNTFPDMNGLMIPPEVQGLLSLHADPAAAQWTHRALAMITLVSIFSLAWRARTLRVAKRGYALAALAAVQASLGAATVLTHVRIDLAALHQAGAFLLGGLCVFFLSSLKPETT